MEAIVLPMFELSGGVDSERSHMKQFIQGKSHLDNEETYPTPKKTIIESEEIEDNLDDKSDLFDEDTDSFTN